VQKRGGPNRQGRENGLEMNADRALHGKGGKMPEEEGKVKWYLRPVSVVLLLFLVLGPFGLPLLYKSPKFSRTLKVILTIAVIVYTSYLIFASLEIGRELYRRMEELQDMLK
jgi:hypothetical protein